MNGAYGQWKIWATDAGRGCGVSTVSKFQEDRSESGIVPAGGLSRKPYLLHPPSSEMQLSQGDGLPASRQDVAAVPLQSRISLNRAPRFVEAPKTLRNLNSQASPSNKDLITSCTVESTKRQKGKKFIDRTYNTRRRGKGAGDIKEPTNSKPGSNQRARVARRGQVHQHTNNTAHWSNKDGEKQDASMEVGKEWISVPLDGMDGIEMDEEHDQKGSGRVNGEIDLEAVKLSDESSEREMNKNEPDRKVIFSTMITGLEDICRVLERDFLSEMSDHSYDVIRKVLVRTRRLVELVEQSLHMIQEKKIERLMAEKAKREAATNAERLKQLDTISRLSQENMRTLGEKKRIELDRDNLRNEFDKTLESARETIRVEIDRKYAEDAETLRKELSTEQDKTCCHICFCQPRDALILPCMHFHYCIDCLQKHQKRNKECPTCRTKISGVLQCNLSTS